MNKIKTLLAEFGYLAEDADNLERDVKDQINRAVTKDEVDTVAFGLETDDGLIVKVYVNAEHAEKFEQEMAKMLGEVDDIEEALNQISKDVEIVDVEWPEEDDAGDDAEDVDAEADDETDGSEVMNSKVYSKKNAEKEAAKEGLTYGEELAQDILIEATQNSIANQLSTVNQHLIYQAILHLGVPELALDKSPYRSAILRGIRDTALEVAHTPSMRNTLKIFIKQQAMDDATTEDDEKHRGKDKHHKGVDYKKGMQAAGVYLPPDKFSKEPKKPIEKTIPKGKVKEAIEPVAPVKQETGVAAYWIAVEDILKLLDPTTDKSHVNRIIDNHNYKTLVSRSKAQLSSKLSSGIRSKLKTLKLAIENSTEPVVVEQFSIVNAEALLRSMFELADDGKGLASKIIDTQLFKRLMLAGRMAIPNINSQVRRLLTALQVEIDKVGRLNEADEVEEEPTDDTEAPKAVEPAPDATETGISFKAEGDSVTVNHQGGSFSLSGEGLERAMKALNNKQTLSVQLADGKFATFSPRGSSAVIKLMSTKAKIDLAPPDISAFIDAGEQAIEGAEAENEPEPKLKESSQAMDELNRAHELIDKHGDADMDRSEIIELLTSNDISQEVAERVATDYGR